MYFQQFLYFFDVLDPNFSWLIYYFKKENLKSTFQNDNPDLIDKLNSFQIDFLTEEAFKDVDFLKIDDFFIYSSIPYSSDINPENYLNILRIQSIQELLFECPEVTHMNNYLGSLLLLFF